VIGDSTTGLAGTSVGITSFGDSVSREGRNPIFLRISSFGDVAISSSSGVIAAGCGGLCFGTARRIVPAEVVRVSGAMALFHFFILDADGCSDVVGGAIGGVEVGAAGNVNVILANARFCVVVGEGMSCPFRLKTDRLRRAMLLKLLADRPLDAASEAMATGYTAEGSRYN
jgi:hypothetical protein